MKHLPSHFLVALLWLLHWLPLPLLRGLGWLLGQLLYVIGRRRCHIVLTNLRLCFPELDEDQRKQLARRHFIAFARAFLDRTLIWWAPEARLRRLIRLHGAEHLHDPDGRPIILLAPHFVGLDAGGIMMGMSMKVVSVYSQQKNLVIDAVLYAGRKRFNDPLLLSRQDGMRKALKALKDGLPFFYLPDMDFGSKDAVFAPFFGVPTATVTGVSRLARLTNARVVACIARMVSDGYEVTLMPPWENFPGESVEADTMRMNACIEEQVRSMPEQYYWVHRRFKTRPPGEASVYA